MAIRLSEKWSEINVDIIGGLYIIFGIWEFLLGLGQLENITHGTYFLLDVYRNYLLLLGLTTFLVGITLLFKLNIARLFAIVLAWWNLFTSPLIHIWFEIYTTTYIRKSIIESLPKYIIGEIFVITFAMIIRLYIIYILRISKAGYIFLKKKEM